MSLILDFFNEISERPVFYRGVGRIKGSYVRVGESDESMSEYEIYSYEAFRKRIRDDIRTIENSKLKMIDEKRMKDYLSAVKNERKNLSDNVSEDEILELMGITNDGVPTLAGLMTFSKYPQSYSPQLCITAVSLPGTEQGTVGDDGERFIDNKRITGAIPNMLELLNVTENRYSGIPAMRTEFANAGLPAPLFSVVHGEFKVVMKNGLFTETRPVSDSLVEFCSTPRTRAEIVAFVGKSKNHVMSQIVAPLLESGKLKMTIPDKPKSSNQKFVKA